MADSNSSFAEIAPAWIDDDGTDGGGDMETELEYSEIFLACIFLSMVALVAIAWSVNRIRITLGDLEPFPIPPEPEPEEPEVPEVIEGIFEKPPALPTLSGDVVVDHTFEQNLIAPLIQQSYFDHSINIVDVDTNTEEVFKVCHFIMKPSDKNTNGVKRSEICTPYKNVLKVNKTNYVAWTMFLPDDFNPGIIDAASGGHRALILGQIHGNNSIGSGPVSVLSIFQEDGQNYWGVSCNYVENGAQKGTSITVGGKLGKPFDPSKYCGKWLLCNWVYRASQEGKGMSILEINGEVIGSRTNANVGLSTTTDPYFKCGIYHGCENEVHSFVNEIRVSTV